MYGIVTLSGSHVVDMGSNKITNVSDPTAQDVVAKSYIESVVNSMNQKNVLAVIAENIDSTYSDKLNTLFTGMHVFTVDGVTQM